MATQQDLGEVLSDEAIIDRFAYFLKTFGTGSIYPYGDKISALNAENNKSITINSDDFEFELYSYFFNNKKVEQYLNFLNRAVQNIYREFHPDMGEDFPLTDLCARISVRDTAIITHMPAINISHRNKLLVFDSVLISKSEKKYTVRQKVFRCSNCGTIYPKKLSKCVNASQDEGCDSKAAVSLSIADSIMADCEFMECQERQDDMASTTSIPIRLDMKVYGDLVGKFKAGDNVRVVGIIKMQKTVSDAAINRSDDDENFTSDVLFDRVVEVHNMERLSTTENMIITNPSKYLTDEDVTNVLKLRKKYPIDDDLMTVLVNSFASHVWGHSMVKESILLQNVGSVEIHVSDDVRTRKNINIFLIGDPGTYKTQLLQAAMRLSTNGHMASGKGASGVGLTASVERDKNGYAKLRIGAAPLANGGHLSLDELLHVSADDQAYLLDCMESGTFRVNKNGINVLVNADANFLISTNPDSGKYNKHNSLFDNVTVSEPFFSRIHITWVMTDIVRQDEDRKMVFHVLKSYDKNIIGKYNRGVKDKKQTIELENQDDDSQGNNKIRDRIPYDLLFKYLLYARINNTKDVTISPEAAEIFADFYNQIRTPEISSDITATPRQLVGMLKLSYARCRTMLRSEVSEDDAIRIRDLLHKSYHSCGMIINKTGGLNLTAEYSKPLDKINKNLAFTMVVGKLTRDNEQGVSRTEIIDELRVAARWTKEDADDMFDKMDGANKLLRDPYGKYILNID